MPNLKMWKSQQLKMLRVDSERLFDRLCSDFGLPSVCQPLLAPDLTIKDTAASVLVEAVLPGMDIEHIMIFVEDAFLIVRCEQCQTCAAHGGESHLFEQRLKLPCRVRVEDASAEFDGELLTIIMPKCQRPHVRRVPVTLITKR